jgi:hypothetical protein
VFTEGGDVHYARLDPGADPQHGGWQSSNLSHTRDSAFNPTIATDGTGIYTAWEEHNGPDHSIRSRYSADGGRSWGEIRRVSDKNTQASTPNAAYSGTGGAFYVVWTVDTGEHYPHSEIWGRSFAPSTGDETRPGRLSRARGEALLPVVTAGPWRIAVAWQSRNAGPWRVSFVGGTFQ